MTIFFVIAFIVLLLARIIFEYFAAAVPVFGELLTALTWLTVAAGIFAAVFIGVKIYKEIKGKKE